MVFLKIWCFLVKLAKSFKNGYFEEHIQTFASIILETSVLLFLFYTSYDTSDSSFLANIYLFKVTTETLKKAVEYVQS